MIYFISNTDNLNKFCLVTHLDNFFLLNKKTSNNIQYFKFGSRIMETKYKAVISGLLIFLFACSGDSKNSSQNSSYSFNVVFTIGTITDDKIYAVWAETTDGDFIQNIWVCQNSIIKS